MSLSSKEISLSGRKNYPLKGIIIRPKIYHYLTDKSLSGRKLVFQMNYNFHL
jgi:hypothetical protein